MPDGEGRIAKAGFDRESWKQALGATFPRLSRDHRRRTLRGDLSRAWPKRLDASDLNAEQKAEMRSFVETKIAETRALRAEGARYVDPVQPYAARLNELLGAEGE
jgi:hypothetical protein